MTTATKEPVTDLLRRIKEVERPDGSWPGADVVPILCEWFTELGYDINVPVEDDDEDDDDRTCARCGDSVQTLSTNDLCDGWVAELDQARGRADR